MPINTSSSDEGVTGAAKFVTSAVGVRYVYYPFRALLLPTILANRK